MRLCASFTSRVNATLRRSLTGVDAATGRPQYVSDLNNVNGSIGEYWFYVDVNLEKYFDLGFGTIGCGHRNSEPL